MGITIGPLHMRRSIFIEASPSRVWEEFESKERLEAWFGTGHAIVAYEPEAGGLVDIDMQPRSGFSRGRERLNQQKRRPR